jgi:hypothetical protein
MVMNMEIKPLSKRFPSIESLHFRVTIKTICFNCLNLHPLRTIRVFHAAVCCFAAHGIRDHP